MDFLPLVILGKNSAFQPDIGASPCELTHGINVKIPGQLLNDPEDQSAEELRDLLSSVRRRTNNSAVQPSRHSPPEKKLPGVPPDVTSVYTKQHQTTGLEPPYEGPFVIADRLTNSTLKIEVGEYKNGEKRYEIRHINDLKFPHPNSLVAPARRPALGRPSRTSVTNAGQDNTNKNGGSGTQATPPDRLSESKQTTLPVETKPANFQTTDRPVRSTRNQNPSYVDAVTSNPPQQPAFPSTWTASANDLEAINRSIRGH